MLRSRVIPCLLLQNTGLVKTVKFKEPRYIGDPINAVKIFNEKYVDELVLLDIGATVSNQSPQFELLAEIASEAFMPLGYGGGIRSLEEIRKILNMGFEKVILNTSAAKDIELIMRASEMFGSQSIVVSIDVKKNFWGKYDVLTCCGNESLKMDPVQYAKKVEQAGAGEILLTSIDRDGVMQGYDLKLIHSVTQAVRIPVIASGGAGAVEDLAAAIQQGHASAVAAGSFFIYYGKHKAVLINVPTEQELIEKGVIIDE